jgi:hypothetical protein
MSKQKITRQTSLTPGAVRAVLCLLSMAFLVQHHSPPKSPRTTQFVPATLHADGTGRDMYAVSGRRWERACAWWCATGVRSSDIAALAMLFVLYTLGGRDSGGGGAGGPLVTTGDPLLDRARVRALGRPPLRRAAPQVERP